MARVAGNQWPRTAEELRADGYRYDNLGVCKAAACQKRIHWYKTPGGKSIPLSCTNPNDEPGVPRKYVPHFSDCPASASFRKPKESTDGTPQGQ